jgi:hypothetical protein
LERKRKENKEIKIKINSKIYDYDCILRTRKVFEQFCEIGLKKELNNTVEVTLTPKPSLENSDVKNLGYEFYNLLLNSVKEMITE